MLNIYQIDICSLIGSDSAWIGFTAATGGLSQAHYVTNIRVTSDSYE